MVAESGPDQDLKVIPGLFLVQFYAKLDMPNAKDPMLRFVTDGSLYHFAAVVSVYSCSRKDSGTAIFRSEI